MIGPTPLRSDDKGFKLNGTQSKGSTQAPPPAVSAPPIAASISSDTSTSVASKTSINRSKDAKPPARKASDAKAPRKVPPIVIEPPPAHASNSPISTTTPNRSRRKRTQNNRSVSSVSSSKKSPSTESSTSLLRPDKSPVVTKDLPPHLAVPPPPETPSFDIKHDIDALVERVRAVAMDRPNTPGSHIDWAGEDDDSLPDLDDWGVKSVTDKSASADQPDLISPILVDALKPLPNIEQGSPLAVPSAPPPEPSLKEIVEPQPAPTPVKDVGDDTPRGGPTGSQKSNVPAKENPHAENAKPTAPTDRKKSDASSKPVVAATESTGPKKFSPLKQSNFPLHPSLPAKPVEAIDALTKRVSRRLSIPPPVEAPAPPAEVEEPPQSGLSESMHASKAAVPQDHPSDISSTSEPQGVTASMHAPIQSAPSHITTHSTPSSSFHPTHGRAHTIGRPGGIRVPFSPSHGQFPDGNADDRASFRDRVNHARTHSSPPTGPGTQTARSRTVHATRPVITVDAISRLARTLGGSPAAKRESATTTSVAAVAKE